MSSTDAITLPPVSMADLDAIAALVAAVGWPHRRADIAALIELGRGRLARAGDDRTLGVGLWWPFGDTAARLGLVVISPDSQGLGIGRRLVEQLLADTAPRSVMLLATPAGRPLYERLGFVEVGAVCQHQGEYSGRRHPDPRIRAATPEDRSAVLGLDAAAVGVPRPAVLDDLLTVGRAFVLVENTKVTGYAIERGFGRGSVVGPVVAATESDAIALFNAAARPGFVRVDLASEATNFGRYLTACGLALDSESPAMLRGHWPASSAPQRIYALASHALG
jgi:GNAT superfamily N-acetyltransferase